MKIRVGLTYGDPKVWTDRQIMRLKPESQFTHGMFIVEQEGMLPMMYDIKFRLFVNDLRVIPAENYAWHYALFDITDMTAGDTEKLWQYIKKVEHRRICYDFPQIIWQWIAGKLGWDDKDNPWHSDSMLQSAEFIINGLAAINRPVLHPVGMHLYSYIEQSGHLRLLKERV